MGLIRRFGMCMHCSQMCDKCKPAEMKAFVCTACGSANILSRADCLYALGYWKRPASKHGGEETDFRCRNCGVGLSDVVRRTVRPRVCRYSQIRCGYPCLRSERVRGPFDAACRKQVLARDVVAVGGQEQRNGKSMSHPV